MTVSIIDQYTNTENSIRLMQSGQIIIGHLKSIVLIKKFL